MLCQFSLQGGDLQRAHANDTVGLCTWGQCGRRIAINVARGLQVLHAAGAVHG